MNEKPIAIPRPLVNQILHHAQSLPEQEVCGLIGAHKQKPVSCYPIQNIADNPSNHYEMQASEQLEAMRTMQHANEQLFAIYHSHPHTQALPSPTDLELANYPEVLYLIISLNTKGVLEMRGFRLLADNPAQEIILLLEEE
jgi:proteasome lid subunit RPN8/RPN11